MADDNAGRRGSRSRRADRTGGRSGGTSRWGRHVLILLLVGAFVIAGIRLLRSTGDPVVHVLSGLDRLVRVRFDDVEVDVAAGARIEQALPAGACHVQVLTTDGRLVMEEDIEVPEDADVVVYNVLGAAPVGTMRILYQEKPGPPLESLFHGGETLLSFDDVDYVFEDPPDRSLKGRKVRVLLLVEVGWRQTFNILVNTDKQDLARGLGLRVARLDPTERDAVSCAFFGLETPAGAAAARRLRDEFLGIAPDNLDIHRCYQQVLLELGMKDDLIREYGEMRDREPGSADFGYLFARLLEAERARPMYEKLFEAHPDHIYIKLGLAWHCFRNLEFQRTHDLRRSLLARWLSDTLDDQARCLVALGRPDEALRLVEKALAGEGLAEVRHVVLYGKLLRRAGHMSRRDDWKPHLDRIHTNCKPSAEEDAIVKATIGSWAEARARMGAVRDPGARQALRVMDLLCKDPGGAVLEVGDATEDVLCWLPEPTLAVLAVAASESEETGLAKTLIHAMRMSSPDETDVLEAALLDGDAAVVLGDLDPEIQAAVLLFRARSLPPGAERDALVERLRVCDILRGPVTTALERWPER